MIGGVGVRIVFTYEMEESVSPFWNTKRSPDFSCAMDEENHADSDSERKRQKSTNRTHIGSELGVLQMQWNKEK